MKQSIQVNYWKCEWCGDMLSDLLFRGGKKAKYHEECGKKKRYATRKNMEVKHGVTN